MRSPEGLMAPGEWTPTALRRADLHEASGKPCGKDESDPAASLPPVEESVGSEAFRAIDRMREALTAQSTGGISPASLALAFFDWSIHLASAPGKRLELIDKASRKAARLMAHCAAAARNPGAPPCIEPLPGDYRFRAEGWHKQPYNFLARPSCSISNGGTTSPAKCPASRRTMKTWCPSPRVRSSTCSRPRTSRSPTPR